MPTKEKEISLPAKFMILFLVVYFATLLPIFPLVPEEENEVEEEKEEDEEEGKK